MPRRVLMQRGDDTFDLVETPAESEHALQEVMKSNPQLIPADDLGLDGDLLVVGRETTLASGAIDLLCLARSGDLVLVEFKTGPQNPDFRHALAQLIDYGSDLWGIPVDGFDEIVRRYLASPHCTKGFASATSLTSLIGLSGWGLEEEDVEALMDRLAKALKTGDFHYVVAAQKFRPQMVRSLEYLNASMTYGRFHLVELVQLRGPDGWIGNVAQVVATGTSRSTGTASSASRANEVEFLDSIADEPYREALADIFSACRQLGILFEWGVRGTSLRLPTTDRREPLSIGWSFGSSPAWSGLRDLTFGVDPASLASRPSAEAAVRSFVAAIGRIDGAKRVTGQLDAYTFSPGAVPAAKRDISEALSRLVDAVNADQGGEVS